MNRNVCCGYLIGVPSQCPSNEYPQYTFSRRNKISIIFAYVKLTFLGLWFYIPYSTYCPFNILWKDVFCLAFYSKWCFVLTNNISSGTICLFCFHALFINIYCKINFTDKNRSDLCSFYSKLDFWKNFIEVIFCFSSLILHYWCPITILWKFQKF